MPIPEADWGVGSLTELALGGDGSTMGNGRLSRRVGVGEADEVGLDSSDCDPRRVGFILISGSVYYS